MKELSRILSQVQASSTLAVDAKFKQMKADGIDVIGFGADQVRPPTAIIPSSRPVAAVRAPSHDKVGGHRLRAVFAPADHDAPARIGIRRKCL